ncbi:MAG: hypothetical protein WCQ96_00405 [Patescibacteria group bacterium]
MLTDLPSIINFFQFYKFFTGARKKTEGYGGVQALACAAIPSRMGRSYKLVLSVLDSGAG